MEKRTGDQIVICAVILQVVRYAGTDGHGEVFVVRGVEREKSMDPRVRHSTATLAGTCSAPSCARVWCNVDPERVQQGREE